MSGEALAVFACAAYRRLSSGQMVERVARRDGEGYEASDKAVSELPKRTSIEADGDGIRFTPEGEKALQNLVSDLRGGRAT